VQKPEHRAKRKEALTDDEVKRLVNTIRRTKLPRAKALMLLLVTTGVRLGEALGLRWEHVDLDGGLARVRTQADADGTATPLKTEESRREIPLIPEAVEALRAIRGDGTGFVFSVVSGKPIGAANVRTKWFAPMLKTAGLEHTGLTPHGLRSVAATLLARKVDPVTLTRLFGWSDGMKTALAYYVKTSESMIAEGREAMASEIARLTVEKG